MFFSEVPEKQHLIWHIPPLSDEPFPPPSSAVHVLPFHFLEWQSHFPYIEQMPEAPALV